MNYRASGAFPRGSRICEPHQKAPRPVVPPPSASVALASRQESIFCLGLGGHAAANAGEDRGALLREVLVRLPEAIELKMRNMDIQIADGLHGLTSDIGVARAPQIVTVHVYCVREP